MKTRHRSALPIHPITILSIIFMMVFSTGNKESDMNTKDSPPAHPDLEVVSRDPLTYRLPDPRLDSEFSVEKAMLRRRSHRNYVKGSIAAEDLSQVLWAAYGITQPDNSRAVFRGGFRTAPSAGATYPLEVYAVVGKVKGIEPGVYRYLSKGHLLVLYMDTDIRQNLAGAALNQQMIADAPASLFYSAIYERTMQRYGERGRLRYVPMDLGHSAQNVYLQVEALGLGTCAIGAFNDKKVSEVMNLPQNEEPLYIMPIGRYYRE